jgi:hypothetical protein
MERARLISFALVVFLVPSPRAFAQGPQDLKRLSIEHPGASRNGANGDLHRDRLRFTGVFWNAFDYGLEGGNLLRDVWLSTIGRMRVISGGRCLPNMVRS